MVHYLKSLNACQVLRYCQREVEFDELMGLNLECLVVCAGEERLLDRKPH
jgi:hypothetical protein